MAKISYLMKSPSKDGIRTDLYPINSTDEVIANSDELSLITDNTTLNEYLEIMNDTYATKQSVSDLEEGIDETIQTKFDEVGSIYLRQDDAAHTYATQTALTDTRDAINARITSMNDALYNVTTGDLQPQGPAIWLMGAEETEEIDWNPTPSPSPSPEPEPTPDPDPEPEPDPEP